MMPLSRWFLLGLAGCASVPEEAPTTFAIENQTQAPIFLQHWHDCTNQHAWYTVFSGDREVNDGDGLCGCSCDAPQRKCAYCRVTCETSQVVELAVGGAREHTWDGLRFNIRKRAGGACIEQLEPEGPLTATLCYGTESFGSYDQGIEVVDPTCRTFAFERGEPEVRWVVEGPAI